jgi:uncharacterized protein YjbI with pentapeptide repeats
MFQDCSFVETVFIKCKFVNCFFKGCDLSLIQLPECAFTSTQFEATKLVGINWTLADSSTAGLNKPIGFLKCVINHSTFIGLSLKGIQIKDCIAKNVDFRDVDLSQADFTGTDLSESLFNRTNLTKADLSQARNYHIDPARNTLKEARFALPEAMSLLYSMDIIIFDETDSATWAPKSDS